MKLVLAEILQFRGAVAGCRAFFFFFESRFKRGTKIGKALDSMERNVLE